MNTQPVKKAGHGYCNKCGKETQPKQECKCPERNYEDGSFSKPKTIEERVGEFISEMIAFEEMCEGDKTIERPKYIIKGTIYNVTLSRRIIQHFS